MKTFAVIGGGAAGFFGAIVKKTFDPTVEVTLLESSNEGLSKVRISGGGRCNATHACFDPKELIKNYPRGSKELLGPFFTFGPKEMVAWFQERGLELKVEKDGRMFPVTDTSISVINILKGEAKRLGVDFQSRTRITSIEEGFIINTKGESIKADQILLATGSQPIGHKIAESFGHTIIPPVPSLFTFNVPKSPLISLSGVSIPEAEVSVLGFRRRGPLLITHWGFSGPAVLALSAFAARELANCHYNCDFSINWLPNLKREELSGDPAKIVTQFSGLPKKLFLALLERAEIPLDKRWGGLSSKELERLWQTLTRDSYKIEGKSTNKEEFVTAGGVSLKEVNFKTMESRLMPGLFFAGEILDIDGVTGGFNFQAAWTTAYLAGRSGD